MKLTALEIKQQKFDKSFRGYDTAEVKSFLNVISTEWEHLTAENRELEEKIEELEAKVEHFERVEGALHETLQTAKESADTKLSGARKEAKQTVEKAETEADSIIKEAKIERQEIRQSIRHLLDRRNEIIGRLRSYLDVALESVDQFAEDEPNLFNLPDENKSSASSDKKDDHQTSVKNSSSAPGADNLDELVDDLD